MSNRIVFSGQYLLNNEAFLRERANRIGDPRKIFYEAMLKSNTYEAYYAEVGNKEVLVEIFRPARLVSGHTEMWYARNQTGWIEDAPPRDRFGDEPKPRKPSEVGVSGGLSGQPIAAYREPQGSLVPAPATVLAVGSNPSRRVARQRWVNRRKT
jgi:hypothetical protein